MNDNEKKLIQLLTEKRDLLLQVLDLTGSAKIGNEPEDYVNLMDSREKLFVRIYEIDRSVGDLGYEQAHSSGSDEFRKNADEIYNVSRATAFRIAEMDTANKKAVAAISETIKGELKAANKRKNIRDLYSDQNKISDGQYFNKTK